jgi:acyl carrier protein
MTALSRDDVYKKIVEIIAQKLQIDSSTIASSATLQDLGADSLDIVEIVMQIEERLEVAIDDAQAEKLHTVDDVVNYVYSLRSK